MGQPITIWGINRAAYLMDPHQDEIIEALGGKVKFGDRTQYNMPGYDASKDLKINLMPDNEYFVPIAPKCIGSRFDSDNIPLLAQIQSYYKSKKQQNYKYFWDGGSWEKGDYSMRTPKYMGYYSILEKTAPNILVGYSQGGLVARYLMWLDNKVFNGNAVAGVITVSSPNYGSPLANPDNKAYILVGLLKIICILVYGYVTDEITKIINKILGKHTSSEETPTKGVGGFIGNLIIDGVFNLLMDIIRVMIKDLNEHGFTKEADTLQSLYNWLGGLRNDPNNAFFDLNITKVTEQNSVLYGINRVEDAVTAKVAGILSANNNPRDLIHPDSVSVIRQSIKAHLSPAAKLKTKSLEEDIVMDIMKHFTAADAKMLKTRAADAEAIDYDAIEEIYNTEVMYEHKTYADPMIQSRVSDYTNGIAGLQVAKYANDFVIPSAYQVTMQNSTPTVQKNTVNQNANHLTGSDLKYAAGQENYADILKYLTSLVNGN